MERGGKLDRQTAAWIKLSIASKGSTATVFSRPLFASRDGGVSRSADAYSRIVHWKQYNQNNVFSKDIVCFCFVFFPAFLTALTFDWWLSDWFLKMLENRCTMAFCKRSVPVLCLISIRRGQIHPGAEDELKAPTDRPGSSHSVMVVHVSFCL